MIKEFFKIDEKISIKGTEFKEDESLPYDGYSFYVQDDGVMTGRYGNKRARGYLLEETEKFYKKDQTEKIFVKDYPAFPIRGVIEGFYGKPYTQEMRLSLMAFLKSVRMNTYIYAPKDDAYHRERWREPYPEPKIREFIELLSAAKANEVEFVFAVSPGKDFRFDREEDFAALCAKLQALENLGVRSFALLMDDIDPNLTEEEKKLFSSPAEAQAKLANRLSAYFGKEHSWYFCPTEYMQNYDTPYRRELRKSLSPEIGVFWTGYNTVAEAVTEEDGETVCASFGRKPILWDNYPVNDFDPKRRVYLGAIDGRGRFLHRMHGGYIANLSELYESSKIPLYTMAAYAWDCEGYRADEALDIAIKKYFGKQAEAGKIFVRHNESNVMRKKSRIYHILKRKNFRAADIYYEKLRLALPILKQNFPAFAEELKELFTYTEAECELYFALRDHAEKKKIERFRDIMNASKYVSADFTLMKYANEKYSLEIPFSVDEERKIYRSWKEVL